MDAEVSLMQFYPHWVGDYQRDTADLSLLEHGAYRLLLDTYYATEQPFPADIGRLLRVARATTPEEQDAVRFVAERFFPVGEDGLRRNARADMEIAKAAKYAEKQRAAASRRWQGNAKEMPVDMPPHIPPHMPEGCQNDANHTHTHTHSYYNNNDNSASDESDTLTDVLQFDTPAAQNAYLAYRRAHRHPASFDALLGALRDGMTTGSPVALEAIGRALLELQGNGEGFNVARLRGYLRGLDRASSPPPASGYKRRGAAVDEAAMVAKVDAILAERGVTL